ncbi:MAG: hypothetical protein AB1714_07765 [Acidobacteriota bacterium]
MIKRIDIGPRRPHEPFAEPTPMGLIGLAIGCAALTPIAFGMSLTTASLKTAAVYCILFGAGCQFLAGMLNFANHNLFGGTLFTAFTFNWLFNYWVLDSLAGGMVPDPRVILAAEICFLIVFVVFTYGFGYFSSLLLAFLLDIDLLYVCRIIKGLTGTIALDIPIALFTVGLGAISLWIAFAMLINPVAGRALFPLPGPVFAARPKPGFDTSRRRALLGVLYDHWRKSAFNPIGLDAIAQAIEYEQRALLPELVYLAELGGIELTPPANPTHARITAAGIDFYEQVALGKHGFA